MELSEDELCESRDRVNDTTVQTSGQDFSLQKPYFKTRAKSMVRRHSQEYYTVLP